MSSPFLYPNVTSVPSQSSESTQIDRSNKKAEGALSEFDQVFERELKGSVQKSDLDQVKAPLKFSGHAMQRLRDRKIQLDPQTMAKVNDAVDKAEAKGIGDTLILTSDAALIVNVKNRTVVTALDRQSASGNIFTNIDGAILI